MTATILNYDGQPLDIDRQLMDISRAVCEEDLVEFIRQSWHIIEPAMPYVHGWHIDFICQHLDAITDGVELDDRPYNRLLVNVPPGTMKSLITNVFWPAWEWGPRNMPHLRYVCAAHKVENLSARDSRRMRQIITSDWYQARWGDRVSLARDQNEKLNFQNEVGGFRIATAITSLTGIRGDRVIIDDPHSVDSASSEALRESEVTTFLEAIPTRLTDPIRSAIVVIMQRLHEQDVSGVILEKELGYDHIMLPMRYDPTRHCVTALGLEDPRSEEGELLFPARFPQAVVDRDERAMGPYASAGQFQQQPTPRGGGVIKVDWWQPWSRPEFPPMDLVVASLDTAYTTKQENDYSALTVWGVFSSDKITAQATNVARRDGEGFVATERVYQEGAPRVMLVAAWQERLELPELVQKVAQTCRERGVDRLLIESKASGLSVSQELRRLYGHEDWAVQLINPGAIDKLARLYSVQHLFSEGMVFAPDRHWADLVIRQCEVFPKGKHDDLCLVGGTMVAMADGSQKPIEEIAEGEWVATPAGARRVTASAFTGIRPIWRLEHQNGFLEGTGNHPVYVEGKWKELEKLCPTDTLSLYQHKEQSSWLSNLKTASLWKLLSSTGIATTAILNRLNRPTAGISPARVIGFTGTSGSFTTDLSRTNIKSITLTGTRETTSSAILSVSLLSSTAPSITTTMSRAVSQKSRSPIFRAFKKRPRNGTPAQRGASGTVRTLSTQSASPEHQNLLAKAIIPANVFGAALRFLQKVLKSCFAQRTVGESVHAISEVYSVRFTHTMRPVFNLTIEGEHCYYANSVLTHNCDTVSQALRHLRDLGVLTRSAERIAEIDDQMRLRPSPLEPLYPG